MYLIHKRKVRYMEMGKIKIVDFNREPRNEITGNEKPKEGMELFFAVFGREFWGLIRLNLLMLLFFLPVITLPAALSAGSRVVICMIQDKNVYVWQDFIRVFKRDFKTSLLAGILFGALIMLIVFVFRYITRAEFSALLLVVQSIILFFVVTAASYTFTSIPFLDIPLTKTIKNAIILTFVRLPYNAAAGAVMAVVAVLTMQLFPVSLIWVIFIALSFSNLIMTFCAYSGIKKHVIDVAEEPEEQPKGEG